MPIGKAARKNTNWYVWLDANIIVLAPYMYMYFVHKAGKAARKITSSYVLLDASIIVLAPYMYTYFVLNTCISVRASFNQ